jgi:hypothetical protein
MSDVQEPTQGELGRALMRAWVSGPTEADALAALCAALGITPAALTALAAGEAVVRPKEPTIGMLWAAEDVLFTGEDDPDKPGFVLFGQQREEYMAMISVDPYAAPEKVK